MNFLDGLLAPVRAAANVRAATVELATLPGVDIVAAGTWELSTGPATFTAADLAAAIEAAACPAIGDPVIKIGHVDPRFDGEPALGHVTNMELAAGGSKITGDLAGMPAWLAEIAPSAYPQRSIEGAYNVKCSIGHLHPFALTGLALLGVSPPGVGVLSGLAGIAALYGVDATWQKPLEAQPFTLTYATGGNVTTPAPMAAGVTTEDVRRAYYSQDDLPMSWWICEMQMSPAQLIVCDEASDDLYRVSYTIKGGAVTFGTPVQVEIEYTDVAATRGTGMVLVYASAADSRAGIITAAWNAGAEVKNLGDDPTAAAIKAMFALPGDTKSDSKLPHHDVAADGTVGAANLDGCSAAIGALNGAQGGVKGVSDADKTTAYNHLAAHLKAGGKTAPELKAATSNTTSPSGNPGPGDGGAQQEPGGGMGPVHTPMSGSHSHAHSAYGSQGGDAMHSHTHTHSGDASHSHTHATAAGSSKRGATNVDLSDEMKAQIRAALGLGEDEEITAEHLLAAAAEAKEAREAKAAAAPPAVVKGDVEGEPVAASSLRGKLPAGIVAMDAAEYERLTQRIEAGEKARGRQLEGDRERALDQAVRAGKFSVARVDHWRRLWNADPEGTAQVIAGLQRGLVPTSDIGAPGEDMDVMDTEYESLFPTQYTRTPVRD
jgi:hypothetical protein